VSDYLPFIFSGLVSGGIYGLAGTGLVLTYKTSGVFNFAYGAQATFSAYLFYTMRVQHNVPWPIAAAVCLVIVGPLMGLLLEPMARAVAGASLAVQVAATVGVLLGVQGAVVLIYGQTVTRTVNVFLGSGETTIGGAFVQYAQIITFAIAIACTAGLYLFFRLTRLGVAMRAVVDDPDLLGLAGTSPVAVRRYAWVVGSTFAALSGILFAPLLPLDSTVLTFLVVQAFGAAALGAFRNLPLTLLGGLLIGVLGSLSTKWFTSGLLLGMPSALPFIVLFIVLLVFPRRYMAARIRAVPLYRPTWTMPARVQIASAAVLVLGLALVPTFAGIHLADWTNALAATIVFLSLGLLVRTSGQVSLGHIAFAAIGGCAFSHFVVGGAHLPWIVGLLASGLICVPIGMLLAIPAIRLTGLYLALATFGFALLVYYMFYTSSLMFGNDGAALAMPSPGFARSGTAFYFFVLAVTIAAALFAVWLGHSRLGRLLRGLGESPTALSTNGIGVSVTRVLVFCISAFLAGVGGALSGVSQGAISVDSFPVLQSLTILALIVIVPGGAPWYALVAGLSFVLIPAYFTSNSTQYVLQVVFGVSAIVYALTPDSRRGAPQFLRRAVDSVFRRTQDQSSERKSASPGVDEADTTLALAPGPSEVPADARLEVEGATVSFGGLVAVDDVTVTVRTGRITGLIGPNGAGKTTLFNVCSGLGHPDAGTVRLGRHKLDRRGPSFRARLGLGRTFQQMELFESLSVWENVAIGREGPMAGSNPLRNICARRREGPEIRRATREALDLCGLAELAHTPVSELSTGHRRLVELARCLAGRSRILLLDEPSSGLDVHETEEFRLILERVVRERHVGILLVEHDMPLVMRICTEVYVLDFGRLIFHGTPDEARGSAIVKAAYLGDDELTGVSGHPEQVDTPVNTAS
jgi:ABC-type branched-subunit amino acid transport system ATPase component/branched-subunit amino acid ABC-type transport system permease component